MEDMEGERKGPVKFNSIIIKQTIQRPEGWCVQTDVAATEGELGVALINML